jgi:hypothetical protein
VTAIRLTEAQAKAYGIRAPADAAVVASPVPARARARRGGDTRAEPVPYHTVCHDCGEHFTVRAVETRHVNATRHARYELELTLEMTA